MDDQGLMITYTKHHTQYTIHHHTPYTQEVKEVGIFLPFVILMLVPIRYVCMVYGVCHMVCCVWVCVVCGMWYVVCGVCVWCMVCGVCCKCVLWCMVYYRMYVLPWFFTKAELEALDGEEHADEMIEQCGTGV